MTERKQRTQRALRRIDPLDSSLVGRKRQCGATSKRTGERCKRLAHPGARTCVMHGAGTKKARLAASKRIAEASGYAAEMLVEFMADPSVELKTRVQIAQDLLSRAGIAGKQQLEIGMQTVSEVYANIVLNSTLRAGEVDDLAPSPRAAPADIIDAEVVVDQRALTRAHESEMDEPERNATRRSQALGRQQSAPAQPEPTTLSAGEDFNAQKEAFLLDRMADRPKRRRRRVTG